MNTGIWWSLAMMVVGSGAERWQWPEKTASSLRIDTKVRFLDEDSEMGGARVQADEAPFHAPAQTDGFYNRAGAAGRYPVRVETPRAQYAHHSDNNFGFDGTLDSLQYCKCVSGPECRPRRDSARACGAGKHLCCYNEPHQIPPKNTEYFNEIEDERPSLLPGQEELARPFPPAPGYPRDRAVLAGPAGPSGRVGPDGGAPAVLVGPEGPTGIIGPHAQHEAAGALSGKHNPDVLVGPGGPTNIVGPGQLGGHRDAGSSETAQQGILVGPGGPTGIIGPRGYGQQRPVLVGPGGPTGIIGPRMQGFFNEFFGRQRNPGILVGPGGPTGIIGPGRQLLVGPGGPTGRLGPQHYFA